MPGVHCPPSRRAPADLPPGRFVADSPLEGDGFEPSVPRQKGFMAALSDRGVSGIGGLA
jgi:hypothetical protein